MYKRKQLATLISRMAEPRRRIQIVMGPRQVGKTTMVEQFTRQTSVPFDFLAADSVWPNDVNWISNHWREARMKMDLHHEAERILIIDEVQKLKNWSEQVKKEWDEDTLKNRNLKVILLGSSRLLLRKGLEESLAGRFETIKMSYWEWGEMAEAFGESLEEFIFFGGLPGFAGDIKDETRWRSLIEDSVISPMLSRDITEIEKIRNPALLRQVFELACTESSRELSLTKMQSSINSGSVPTIKNYLDILDKTMAVSSLQKFSPSPVKVKQSVPKMQVYDNGFRSRYSQYSFEEALQNPTEWGRLVESAVGAHLANRSVIDGFDLGYWRNEKKQECDFVLRRGQALVAIEVKSGRSDDTAGFEAFKKLYSKSITSAFIVGAEGLPLGDFFALKTADLFKRKGTN